MAFQPYQSVAGQVQNDVAAQQARTEKDFFQKEGLSIEKLLNTSDSFRLKLQENRTKQNPKFMGPGGVLMKYPFDLGSNPEYRNILQIQIWQNDPVALSTRRQEFFSSSDKSIQKQINENKKLPKENQSDLANVVKNTGGVLNTVVSDGGKFIKGAVGAGSVKRGTGRGEYSYVEEATGVQGMTKPIGSIYLYCPPGFSTSYGLDYDSDDLGGGLEMLRLIKAMAKDGDGAVAKEIARSLVFNNIKDMEVLGVKGQDAINLYQAQNRMVQNPLLLHTFKKVNRRSFEFSFDMYPKNSVELDSCYAILNTLKYHAHPKRSEGGRFLDYPSEFKLNFLNYDGSQNQYMPKIFRSVLREITVKYGEDVVMTTFKPLSSGKGKGAPTKINFTLKFDELEILTQDRFETGGTLSP